jgi:hypothetical protein
VVVDESIYVERLGGVGLPVTQVDPGSVGEAIGLKPGDTIVRFFNDAIAPNADMITLEDEAQAAWSHPEPLCMLVYVDRSPAWWDGHCGGWGNWKVDEADTIRVNGMEAVISGYISPWHMDIRSIVI